MEYFDHIKQYTNQGRMNVTLFSTTVVIKEAFWKPVRFRHFFVNQMNTLFVISNPIKYNKQYPTGKICI